MAFICLFLFVNVCFFPRVLLKKCFHFPISRNLADVQLHNVSSGRPEVSLNGELPIGEESLLNSTETGNESEKNTDETNLTSQPYVDIQHLEDSNGYISHEVSFFNDIKRPPLPNGNLPRDNFIFPGPDDPELSGETFLSDGFKPGPMTAKMFQLNVGDSAICNSSQPAVVSGYVDPTAIFSKGN